MKFSLRSNLIFFTDSLPGNHATLFSTSSPGGTKFPFSGDDSLFDNIARSFTWAFRTSHPLKEGEEVVFAVSDRAVLGRVIGSEIRVLSAAPIVERGEGGKPERLVRVR